MLLTFILKYEKQGQIALETGDVHHMCVIHGLILLPCEKTI
jgi:hypothetical protein